MEATLPSMARVCKRETALLPPTAFRYWSIIFCASSARTGTPNKVVRNRENAMNMDLRMAIHSETLQIIQKVAVSEATFSRFLVLPQRAALGRLKYFSYKAFCLLSVDVSWPLIKR